MERVSNLLDKKLLVFAKNSLKSLGRNGMLARKLNAVINTKKHGIRKAADFYDIIRSTLTAWVNHLKYEEITKLLTPKERKKKTILNNDRRIMIGAWIKRDR